MTPPFLSASGTSAKVVRHSVVASITAWLDGTPPSSARPKTAAATDGTREKRRSPFMVFPPLRASARQAALRRLFRTTRRHRAAAGEGRDDDGPHVRRDRDESDVPDPRGPAPEELAYRGGPRPPAVV